MKGDGLQIRPDARGHASRGTGARDQHDSEKAKESHVAMITRRLLRSAPGPIASILARMDGFVRLGEVADFPRGRARKVVAGGVPVAVFRDGERFVVVADACPHMGASLAEGKLEAGHLVCAWHGWTFDVRTGDSGRRSGATLDLYETRVVSGELWARPKPEAPRSAPPPDAEDDFVPFDPDRHFRRKD